MAGSASLPPAPIRATCRHHTAWRCAALGALALALAGPGLTSARPPAARGPRAIYRAPWGAEGLKRRSIYQPGNG